MEILKIEGQNIHPLMDIFEAADQYGDTEEVVKLLVEYIYNKELNP